MYSIKWLQTKTKSEKKNGEKQNVRHLVSKIKWRKVKTWTTNNRNILFCDTHHPAWSSEVSCTISILIICVSWFCSRVSLTVAWILYLHQTSINPAMSLYLCPMFVHLIFLFLIVFHWNNVSNLGETVICHLIYLYTHALIRLLIVIPITDGIPGSLVIKISV